MQVIPSPFHPRTAELATANGWSRWSGYTSANFYADAELEYFAVRNQCGLMDITPMTKYQITGEQAGLFLNKLVTRDIRKLIDGRMAYVVFCNDNGHVIDDGTLFKKTHDEFWLCTQDRHLPWLLDTASGFKASVEDISEKTAALALQGPTSCAVLKRMGLDHIQELKPFHFTEYKFGASKLMISRSGYTGDLGYELWTDKAGALALWDDLFAAGKYHGLSPFGLQTLDWLRLEAGYIAPHKDFMPVQESVRQSRGRSPFDLGLGWLVDFDQLYFNGKRALRSHQSDASQTLVGLLITGNKPAHDAWLYAKHGKRVGHVTSAMWSPTCKQNIALAWLDKSFIKRGADASLWADVYLQKELKWQRVKTSCKIVDKRFFNPRRRAQMPAPVE